jgi:hypothetical protein
MQYSFDPIDQLVREIKGTATFITKVLFTSVNIVFLVAIVIILLSSLVM